MPKIQCIYCDTVYDPERTRGFCTDCGREHPPGSLVRPPDVFKIPVATATGRVVQAAPPGYPEVPVFSDTGTYLFRVSEMAEISASLTCSVRYTGERAAAGTGGKGR